MTIQKIVVAAILIGSLGASGCSTFDALHTYCDISEAPPHGGSVIPLGPRASTIQPYVAYPVSSLQPPANDAVSKLLPFNASGSSNIAKWEIDWPGGSCCFFKGSIDANWQIHASQIDPVRVVGGSDRLTAELDTAMNGSVGINGTIAQWLSLSGKNVSARAAILASTGLAFDRSYCPTIVDPGLDYRWISNPEIEIIGKSCVNVFGSDWCVGPWDYDFSSSVDPQIRNQIPSVMQSLAAGINCSPIRGDLQKVWGNYSFPLDVPYLGAMFVNISPQALFVPRLGIDATNIVVRARLDADTVVAPTPGPVGSLPLPYNDPLPISPGDFSLSVPVALRYYTLEALASQAAVGREFPADTPVGKITVRPTNIQVYPSGDHLAIGVSFVLNYEHVLLNTSGTVWFSSKIDATPDGKQLRLSEVAVTRKFSSPLWEIASIVLDDQLRNAISNGFQIDLTKPLGDTEAAITQALSSAGNGKGFELIATNVNTRVGRIATQDDVLVVEGLLDATVVASIESTSLNK